MRSHAGPAEAEHDVAIVGFGPVGAVLAALLGAAGHSVAAYERFEQPFPLPRAVRLDGEAMRTLHRIGVTAEIQRDAIAATHYPWYGADHELIVDIPLDGAHPSGWLDAWHFYQPDAEAALEAAVSALPSVEIHRGWAAQSVTQGEDAVELLCRRERDGELRHASARYVVGADGAHSLVRETCAIDWRDLGFAERWLVCDVRPHDIAAFAHLPEVAQYCDPLRPYVGVRTGRHLRWEFMVLEGERGEPFAEDPAAAWRLLERHIAPGQGTLIRHAVYEFRSLIAERMNAGRALLVGDAAHLMPPFMGLGLCSGIRDAANLAWRLDLILRGVADPQLLESYTTERRAQNESAVKLSIQMGQISCTTDPAAARERDSAFRSGRVPPPPLVPGLGPGVAHRAPGDPIAGTLAVQGRVERAGVAGRFDDVIGSGFNVICVEGDPREHVGAAGLRVLEALGANLVSLDPSVAGAARDLDGALSGWLAEHGLQAVITRPDFYAFGGVKQATELAALVEDLRAQLTGSQPAREAPASSQAQGAR